MTLITRAGVFSWIETRTSSSIKDTGILEALKMALERLSSPVEVEAWKTRLTKS
jgi:hypothetical protein